MNIQWEKEKDKKEHPFRVFYPFGFFIYEIFYEKLTNRIRDRRGHKAPYKSSKSLAEKHSIVEEVMKNLYTLDSVSFQTRLYKVKKLVLSLLVFFVANGMIVCSAFVNTAQEKLKDGKYIERPSVLDDSKNIRIQAHIGENEKEEIQILVEERKYTREEFEQIIEREIPHLEGYVLGKNKSLDEVEKDLNFISYLPNTPISVQWSTSDAELVDKKGNIHFNKIKEKKLVEVTATISYEECSNEYSFWIGILPKVYTRQEQLRKKLEDILAERMKESRHKDLVELPVSMEDEPIKWSVEEKGGKGVIFLLGLGVSLFLYPLMDKDLMKKKERRDKELLTDYPEMIHKFTLYIGAGMSLFRAWEKIVKESEGRIEEGRYLYKEMLVTYKELTTGVSEIIAYERFGRRIKLIPYLRFSSYLEQSTTKGNHMLLSQLELEAAESFALRKEMAKQKGEEAGTKLLFPMMIMLGLVLVIIIVPAFSSIGF